MKVLCDLYPLGKAVYGNNVRTGVYRVVEHLVRGLAASDQCTAYFHAFADFWPSLKYYEDHLRSPCSHYISSARRNAVAHHLSTLEKFVHTTVQNRHVALRALRYGITSYVQQVDRLLGSLPAQAVEGIDLYHSPFLPIPSVVKRHCSLRRFTTVYDLIPLSHPQFFGDDIVRLIRSLADGLNEEDHAVCISEATRQALLEHVPRLDPARAFVTPLAAGPAFYPERDPDKLAALRQKINLPSGVPYFLSLCTLEPRKNLDAVIRAFARLRRERQIDAETRLVLVGNLGWKTEKILAALDEAQDCRDAILLTGFVPDEDLAALYSGALAFVYMSWLEGFGLPPLEAMQCGVPVITSNTSSLPEVVGDAGIMLSPTDADGLAAAMLSLATDPTRRDGLSSRALDRAASFSWNRFVQQNLAAYRTALSRL